MKIRSKLLVLYLAVGALPLLALAAYLVSNTGKLVLEQHGAQTAADNRRVKSLVFAVTYLATNMAETIFYDEQLREIIARRYYDDAQVYEAYRGYRLLDAYLANYTEVSSITLYVSNPTMLESSRFRMVSEEVARSDWYREAAESSGEIRWFVGAEPGRSKGLRLARRIPGAHGEEFAVLVVAISGNHLKLMIDDSSMLTIAALDGRSVFYSADIGAIGGPLPIEVGDDERARSGIALLDGAEAVYSTSLQSAVKAVGSFRIVTIDPSALAAVRRVTSNMALLAAASFAFPCLLILLSLGALDRRIGTLRREMHKVAGGDFEVVDSLKGRDEISDVFADMKAMVECIRRLTREVYNEKLTKERIASRQRHIELKVLSSQINPHFLFNTLETIRMRALLNGDKEVANITKLLGKSIRRVLEVGNAPVSLASELRYVEIYMEIQAFRFRDRISYGIRVGGDVQPERYDILPLLLQPLVENAIVHGIEGKEGAGRVSIDIDRQAQVLLVAVSDDGVGMGAEQRASLQARIQEIDCAHAPESIGLSNVNQRIKLYYGPEYGLEIRSAQNQGTVVALRLPADGKGAEEREGPHARAHSR